MAKEADLQSKIIKYLRSKGAIPLKYQQNATTRASIPDILFLKEGFWGAIEVKRSKTAKYRPGQKEMVAKMDAMSWARVVYPENWSEVQKELSEILR
jgi:Holliday junction resolvase